MCSISSMVERSPSRTAHMWLTCMVMPSCVAFPQWWRDIHVWGLTHMWRGHSRVEGTFTYGSYSRVEGTFTCGTYSRVEGTFTCGTCVTHVHGNALMCSIHSMVEGSPSRTAHVWLTCTVMPSRVAFPQWWRGAPHIQLTCRGDIHVWDLLTCGGDIHVWRAHSRVEVTHV